MTQFTDAFADQLCKSYLINDWNDRSKIIHMTVEAESAVNVKQLLSYLKKPFEEIYQIYIIIEKQEKALLHSDSKYSTQLSIKKKPDIKKKLNIKKKSVVKKKSIVKKKPYISMKFDALWHDMIKFANWYRTQNT